MTEYSGLSFNLVKYSATMCVGNAFDVCVRVPARSLPSNARGEHNCDVYVFQDVDVSSDAEIQTLRGLLRAVQDRRWFTAKVFDRTCLCRVTGTGVILGNAPFNTDVRYDYDSKNSFTETAERALPMTFAAAREGSCIIVIKCTCTNRRDGHSTLKLLEEARKLNNNC